MTGVGSDLCSMVSKHANRYGVPNELLHAIVQVESGYSVRAVNGPWNSGVAVASYGLGQLTEDTARQYCGLEMDQIYSPEKNLGCSAKVLRHQLKRYGGDFRLAVAAYNTGTAMTARGRPMELKNQNYVDRIFEAVRNPSCQR